MIDHTHYTYRVTWSEEDDEHVALCAEFPSLSFLADKPAKALQGTIPEPISRKRYSGKFQVRIPPEQHRNLAINAAEQGTSLNRYVSLKLAS